jgi:TfoX/Sxy family transcriptional regulator of competence genes
VPDNKDVVDRVRAALSAHDPVREVRMFGGLSFMVNDRMVVSVRGDDELLVRADPARADQLLMVEGARTAEMGAGRAMSKSWISVIPEATATGEGLDFWIGVALEYNNEEAGDTHRAGRKRRGSA